MVCLMLFILLSFIRGQQTIFLTQNENYKLQEKSIILETNNTQDLKNFQYILISGEIKRLSQGLIQSYYNYTFIDPVQDIITFTTYDKNDIYVCLIKYNQIECNHKILNIIVNDELMVYQNKFLTFNQTNCYNIHHFIENLFVLECKRENGLELLLINSNDIILNNLQINQQYNQTLNSLITGNQLILYENEDCIFYFYFISYHNSKLHQRQKILDLKHFQNIGNFQTLKLKKNNQIISIFYQYAILDFDILSFEVIIVKNNKPDNYYQFYSSIIYEQIEYFIAIDYQNNNGAYIQKDLILINPECQSIISINFINENILVNCLQFLTIYNNNLMSLKFDINMRSIKYLEDLPYIILVNKTRNMEFLKINDLPNYFCNLNSSYIFAYYVKNFIVYDSPIQIIQNKYSLENPLLLVQNISIGTFYVSKDINLFQYSLMFQQGLPYSIENTLFNESSLQSTRSKLVFEQQMGMQWGQQIFMCKISYHLNYTTLTQNANGTFTINDSNQIIQFKTEFNPQNSKIYFSTQGNQFLIIQNKTIRAFSFDKKVNLVWIMKINTNITNIFRYQNILLIQLQECIEIEIDLFSFNRKQINNSLQFNCSYYLNSYFLIKINRQEINLYSMFSYHLRIICNQIIEFVPVIIYKRLIIFELIDDKIQIKLYIIKFGQFNYLFYLPLYEFQIVYPLEYRIEKSQIAIVASNYMDQEFVLIYDIKNQVANCLVKVIRIDNKNYYFNFLSEFQIFVVYQQQLIILFLSCLELSFSNQHLKFDNLISQEDLFLQIISDIYNQSLQIQLKVISINMNYKIQIKDVMIPFQYQINQKQQIKSLNFENIYGNIDFMIRISQNNTQRLEPMQINYAFSCNRFFQNSTCINKNDIIFNAFDNAIQMEIPESCLNLLFVQDKKEYFSFYCWIDQKSFERFDVNIYGFILKEKTLNISDFNINLYLINQTNFVQNVIITYSHNISNQFQIWFVKEDSFNLYIHESNSRFNTATVIYLNNHYIIFYSFLEENKNIILCAILMDDLFNIQNQIQIELIEIIKDYNFVIFQQLKEVQFIDYNLNGMILSADSIFCFAIFSCIRLNLDVDFQLKIIKSQMNNYLRYPEKTLCYFNCYQGNQENLILTLIKDKNRVSYFYNLTQKILIDSYYQYSVQNVYFQQYNKSHYIQINKKNNIYEVSLLYLSGYQIQCQDQCQTNVEMVQINNQISILDLEFYSNQDQNYLMDNSQNYTQIIICLNNLILLLSFLRYHKKRNNPLN